MSNIKSSAYILFLIAFVTISQCQNRYERKQYRNEMGEDYEFRIINGRNSEEAEFPHMALIGYQSKHEKVWKCGGTLISSQCVLTAAHCLYTKEYGPAIVVKLGALNTYDKDVQEIDIKEKIPHPDYDPISRYSDIGIIKLKNTAKIELKVRPGCLFRGETIPTTTVTATGWGQVQFNGESSRHLLKVDLQIFSAARCNNTFNTIFKHGVIDEIQVCAGSDTSKADTCDGDSGGPIQIPGNKFCDYEVVGLTSLGINCGIQGRPAVYTRIYPYLEWIEKTILPAALIGVKF